MAGQDYKRLIPAGGAFPLDTSGDYIFLKFADRPIDVIVNGGRGGQTRITMEAGDKYRPGPFEALEFQNPDTSAPAQVVVTVGEGDFNRQIVRGEIQVEPGLRKADGTFAPDTRRTLAIDLVPSNIVTTSYAQGDEIDQWTLTYPADTSLNRARFLFPLLNGNLGFLFNDSSGDDVEIQEYDAKTKDLIYTQKYSMSSFGSFMDAVEIPGYGVCALDNGRNLKRVSDNSIILTGESGFNSKSVAYDPFKKLICLAANSDHIARYNLDLELVDKVYQSDISVSDIFRVDWTTGEYLHGDFGTVKVRDPDTGSHKETINIASVYFDHGFIVNGNRLYADNTSLGGSVRWERAFRPFTTKPEFRAIRPGCGLVDALVKPGALPQVTADITVASYPNGVSLDGELIKAAIEYLYRREAPEDYLDHVYQFDVTRTANGLPFNTVTTGNRTFARAGIADEFDALLPGRIVLTIDNELTLGGAL